MSADRPIKKLRLLENHSLSEKMNKLMMLMDEFGISLYIQYNGLYIEDSSNPNISFELIDRENRNGITNFPPELEFDIIYDNPEYLKHIEEESRKYHEEQTKKEEEKKQAEVARREKIRQEMLEQKKQQDLAHLARLKAIYEPTT
jgi:hypothetical protein